MIDEKSTRRRFLVATVTFSGLLYTGVGASIFRASAAWAQSPSEIGASNLGRFARLLYPHAEISDTVYADVIGAVLAAAANDASLSQAIEETFARLDALQDKEWLELDEVLQISAMETLQSEPYFGAIQGQVMGRFYSHPAVWQLIKYPGSAKEFGGYLERGFNDIDWLPEEAQ
jgi:hypothetical protein